MEGQRLDLADLMRDISLAEGRNGAPASWRKVTLRIYDSVGEAPAITTVVHWSRGYSQFGEREARMVALTWPQFAERAYSVAGLNPYYSMMMDNLTPFLKDAVAIAEDHDISRETLQATIRSGVIDFFNYEVNDSPGYYADEEGRLVVGRGSHQHEQRGEG